MLAILYVTRAVSILLLLGTHQPYLLLTFAVLFGLVDFATVAPTTLLVTAYFKRYSSIGFVIGLLSLSHQLGSALGAYIPGLVYKLTGEYQLAFAASILLLLLASLLSIALPDPRRLHGKEAAAANP